jgi:hypothetical protein
MPADLDQFRRNDSHGTIIGGKRLIQLSHAPAYGRAFFQEIDVISRISQVERGLHPCDPAAYHQYGSPYVIWHWITPLSVHPEMALFHPDYSGPELDIY